MSVVPKQAVTSITINKERLLHDLNAVSRIGLGDHGSVTRLVFSIKELRSRQLFIPPITPTPL